MKIGLHWINKFCKTTGKENVQFNFLCEISDTFSVTFETGFGKRLTLKMWTANKIGNRKVHD